MNNLMEADLAPVPVPTEDDAMLARLVRRAVKADEYERALEEIAVYQGVGRGPVEVARRVLGLAALILTLPLIAFAGIILPGPGTVEVEYLSKLSAYTHVLSVQGTPVIDSLVDPIGHTVTLPVDAGPLALEVWVRNTGISYDEDSGHLFLTLIAGGWVLDTEDLPIQPWPCSGIEGIEPDCFNDFRARVLYSPQPVPEHGSLGLVGLGLVWLGWRRRR